MGVSRRTRLAQKRRWRPSLVEIVAKTFRKHGPAIAANVTKHNPLFQRVLAMECEE